MNRENAKIMARALIKSGIENEAFHIGVMATIAKESGGFTLQRERSYRNTDNSRIRKNFSRTRKLSDAELNTLKRDEVAFFNFVYNGKLGNRKGTYDGYNFRGAGWPQVTGRGNFKRVCPDGIALDELPWCLQNSPEITAQAAIKFFKLGLIRLAVLRARYGALKTHSIGILWACNIAAGLGHGNKSNVMMRAVANASKYLGDCIQIYNEVKGKI